MRQFSPATFGQVEIAPGRVKSFWLVRLQQKLAREGKSDGRLRVSLHYEPWT
jgi:hypothetical protein